MPTLVHFLNKKEEKNLSQGRQQIITSPQERNCVENNIWHKINTFMVTNSSSGDHMHLVVGKLLLKSS
jgi:hypothetical protein